MGANRQKDTEALLPLTPVALNILLALADEERHGYGIGVEVRERTGGRMRLGPGTLYGSIKRMASDGLVEESEAPTREDIGEGRRYDAERRRPFRLTRFGERVLAAELDRLKEVMSTAREKGVLARPHEGAPREPPLGRKKDEPFVSGIDPYACLG